MLATNNYGDELPVPLSTAQTVALPTALLGKPSSPAASSDSDAGQCAGCKPHDAGHEGQDLSVNRHPFGPDGERSSR